MQSHKTGVVLLNMGGPEKLADVEPFLFNLFSDREIIRLGPWFLQKFIARKIAKKRAPKSAANYEKIGSKSPINAITAAQAAALEQALQNDGDFRVVVAMRYWRPRAQIAVAQLLESSVDRIIVLPLYPHYSAATNGSSINDFKKTAKQLAPEVPVQTIQSWPDAPQYIKCLATRIEEKAAIFEEEPFQLVYSAHSLPQKFVDQGDPYVKELQMTIEALEKQTNLHGKLCYQSRSGPVKWLEPSTPDMLGRLAKEGYKNILMLPISFVSDHIETLYEIDMLFKDQARDLGMRLESTRALNDDHDFIKALREILLAAL